MIKLLFSWQLSLGNLNFCLVDNCPVAVYLNFFLVDNYPVAVQLNLCLVDNIQWQFKLLFS